MGISAILELLSDGKFHSGEELGELLGVSRTAVWKHLKKIDALGLSLLSVKGKGYCLEGGLELLDRQNILNSIAPEALGLLSHLDICTTVDSTNSQALSHASEKDCAGYVCLAEQQTSGKGRRGRHWVSPFGKNIYFSALWGFEGGAAGLEGLSLAVGIAVVRALSHCGLNEVQLKWPNDVLWQNRKLAGILLEMTGDVSGYCQVVIGIGVNIEMPAQAGSQIDQQWVDAKSINNSCSRNVIAASIISELLPLLNEFSHGGFALFRQEWERLDAYRGQLVELKAGSKSHRGVNVGVSESGAIRLEIDGCQVAFSGGEISLRPAAGFL